MPTNQLRFQALLIVGIVLCPAAAWANMPPDPITYASVALILPVLAGCMVLGGAFSILAAKRPVRRGIRALGLGFIAFLLLFGLTTEGSTALAWLVSMGVVIVFSTTMIVWAIKARRPPENRRPFLKNAEPKRLLAAAMLVILLTAVFTHIFFSFFNRYPIARRYELFNDMNELLNYQLASSKKALGKTGIPAYVKPSPDFASKEWLVKNDWPPLELISDKDIVDHAVRENYVTSERWISQMHFPSHYFSCMNCGIEFWIAPDRRSFKIWIWPNSLPDWPYNYLVTMPSYFADQTGQIRMIKVHRPEKCPEDAPIIKTVKQ